MDNLKINVRKVGEERYKIDIETEGTIGKIALERLKSVGADEFKEEYGYEDALFQPGRLYGDLVERPSFVEGEVNSGELERDLEKFAVEQMDF